MTLPLEGLLVVSLEQAVAAPMCTCRLADAGARVIKIERPEGDFARGYDDVAGGESQLFRLAQPRQGIGRPRSHQGRRQGAAVGHARARPMCSCRTSSPARSPGSGFRSTSCGATHPRLIACSVSGYGDEGPYADRKAYDLLVQAEVGLASITGGPTEPARVGVSVCDIGAGMNAYEAMLEALDRARQTGEGAALSVSLFDAMADWMAMPLLQQEGGKPPKRVGLAHTSIAPYGVFKSRDGADILISIQSDREWRVLAEQVLGDKALAADPDFATNVERVKRRAETDARVAAVFASLDVEPLIVHRPQPGVVHHRAGRLHRGRAVPLGIARSSPGIRAPFPPGCRPRGCARASSRPVSR